MGQNNLNLPSVQDQTHTEWELYKAFEIKILDKSSYSKILGNLGVGWFQPQMRKNN